jgi:predicted RecB family nuclease
VVPDYDKFQHLKKEVDKFFKFVEHQKEQKFPKESSEVKSDELIKKLEKVSKDSDEKIDTTIKRVAVWGGETVSDLPLIDYNETTGKGEVVGKKKFKFKDGSAEYTVFKMLYAKLGKKPSKLERLDVLVAGGFYPDHQQELDPVRKTAETACINEIAKNIREKTGLNTEELVNNNGSLTLLALRQDKNPPKVTKFVPVWG